MMNRLILIMNLLLLSSHLLAAELVYEADVEGMVCAFCAYSVSRNVSGLPGVDADSVDVDLDKGKVTFSAFSRVSEEELVSVFSDAGFRVSGLREVDPGVATGNNDDYQLALELTINQNSLSALESVLESVGDLAAGNSSKMVLTAPSAYEEDLLKPILMGRRQVMKVSFVPAVDDAIQLQLFLAATGN